MPVSPVSGLKHCISREHAAAGVLYKLQFSELYVIYLSSKIFKVFFSRKSHPGIYPSLQTAEVMPPWYILFIVYHHIRAIPQVPQSVYSFQILLQSCVVSCQHVHSHFFFRPTGDLLKLFQFRDNHIPISVIIPSKMYPLNLHPL